MKPIEMPPKSTDDSKHQFQSAIETSVKAQDLVERALDLKFTISTRELLATLADVRKHVKDILTSRKVSVNHVEVEDLDVYLNNFADEVSSFTNVDLQKYEPSSSSAVSSLPLRIIYPLFGPGIEVECILDSGAQIVIMRHDIWEKLRVPITSSKATNLEAANASMTLTMGLVENLLVKMGPITIYLQVQVVQDAPFEVLLG